MGKGRLQWEYQQAGGRTLCHLPEDAFPVCLMKFDTNKSLCFPLFPAQRPVQHTVCICTRHKGWPDTGEGVAGPGTSGREVPLRLSVVIHQTTDTRGWRAVSTLVLFVNMSSLHAATDWGGGSRWRVCLDFNALDTTPVFITLLSTKDMHWWNVRHLI